MLNSVSALGSYALDANNQQTTEAELSALRQQWMEQRADSDQDGRMTRAEFGSAYAQFQSQAGGNAKLPSAEDLFKSADGNGDGSISKQEFVAALQQLYGQTTGTSTEGSSASQGLSSQQLSAEEMLLSLQQGLGLEQYLGTNGSTGTADDLSTPVLSPAMAVMAENVNASNPSTQGLLALQNGNGLDQYSPAKNSNSMEFTA